MVYVSVDIFVTVVIAVVTCMVVVGIVAITTQTTVRELKSVIRDTITKRDSEIKNINDDVEKLREKKFEDTIYFTETLAKFNVLLTKNEGSTDRLNDTISHTNELLKNMDLRVLEQTRRMNEQNDRIKKLESGK